MKKQLLCTSAIALGVAAAPAAAQDWNLDWGGFFNQHVAFGDISVGNPALAGTDWRGDSVSMHTNAELHFTPSITLDNGMTFGATIELEGLNTGGGRVDESYVSISSDTFGRLDLGFENSAGYKLMVAAPGVISLGINSPSTSAFIPFTGTGTTVPLVGAGFRQAFLSTSTEVAQGGLVAGSNNDVARITYYTPDFNGLTVGISYAPEGATNAGNAGGSFNKNTTISDIFDIGVNYSNSFGSTDLTLSARWGTADSAVVPGAGETDPETWGVGFQVGFGDFTVGGAYAENDTGLTPAQQAAFGGDSEGWSFGATYDTAGPWAFEAQTFQSEMSNHLAVGNKLDREAYRIGASRTMGPGVDWDIYVIYEERDNSATAFTEVEGTILGTAINLSF